MVGTDWRYVVSKTKHLDKSKHIVPPPEQALVLLRKLPKTCVVNEGAGCSSRRSIRVAPSIRPPCSSPFSVSGRSVTSLLTAFVPRTEPSLTSTCVLTQSCSNSRYLTVCQVRWSCISPHSNASATPGGGSAMGELRKPVAAKRGASPHRLMIQINY